MSIIVGKIADKFWSNGSYKQPNTFPIYEKQITLERIKPSINSFMSGDIYLEGGDWNHCIYNGAYYALHILKILDAKKNKYHYRLERELWFDVLQSGALIRGDLSTSSNEELLEEHIHKTVGILDNPTRVTTINFKTNENRTSFDSVQITLPKLKIKEKLIIKQAFENFLEKLNPGYKWDELNKKFFDGARNPAIYIIGKLDTSTVLIEGWRQKVLNKVSKFLENLKDNKDQLKISKLTTPAQSKLVGNYCITYKGEGAIGTSDEPYEIKEIDLSGLVDVQSINISTLLESTPLTPIDLNKNELGGLFDEPTWLVKETGNFFGKISRIPHTPVGHGPEAWKGLPNPSAPFNHKQINWKGTRPPQQINWLYKDRKGTANLWWVDYMNGIFWNYTSNNSEGYNIAEGVTKESVVATQGGAVVVPSKHYYVNKKTFDNDLLNTLTHIPFSIPRITVESIDSYGDPFSKVKEARVGLGFLIFQIYKNIDQWDLFEYKGTTKLSNISYISGISSDFFKYYEESKKEHWFDLSDYYQRERRLAKLQPDGSEAFVRCLLDNEWLAWLAFLPQDNVSGYAGNYWRDDYGIYYYRGYEDYAYLQIRRDIRDIQGNVVELSPYTSPESYKTFRTKKNNKLRNKLIWSNLDFSDFEEGDKDIVIEQGDYFFSDLDYTVKIYKENLILPDLTHGMWNLPVLTNEQTRIWKIQSDAISSSLQCEDYIMPIQEKEAEPGIYLCTRKDGRLDIRLLKKATATLSLSKDDKQTVENVNGLKDRKTTFYLMKHGYIIEQGKELDELNKKNILRDIYEYLGYKVSERVSAEDNTSPSWLWYSSEDLEQKQLLFDLIGTNWYCLLNKGKVNLISKSIKPFKSKGTKSEYLNHAENKKYTSVKDDKSSPTLLERINQKVQFRFLTSSYDLNWKTNFNDSDQLSLVYESAKANEKRTGSDHYYLWLDSKHDVIWWEIISISKLHTDKAEQLAGGAEIEALNLDILRSKRLFEANQGRYQLSAKRINENIRRSQAMLDIQKKRADINFATGLMSSLVGGGFWIGNRASAIMENARGFHDEMVPVTTYEEFPIYGEGTELSYGAGMVPMGWTNPHAGVMLNQISWGSMPVTTMEKRGVRNGIHPWSVANAALGFVGQGGAGIANLIGNYAITRGQAIPARQTALNMQQKLGSEQLALQSLSMNTAFMHEQLTAQMEMNRIFSRYDVPLIADSNLNDEYRKNVSIHGKELQKAHLVVYTPSAEQMKYIEEYVEEYGVKCDIPDVEIQLYPGMPGGIFCYRNLEDKGIEGIGNIAIRQYLKTKATTGVKIVEITSPTDSFTLWDSEKYKKQLALLNIVCEDARAKIENEYREEIKRVKRQAELDTERKIEELRKTLTEECKSQTNVNELNKQLEECNKEKEHANEQLKVKTAELAKAKDEAEGYKESTEELTQQLNDERRKFLDERDKINALNEELKENKEELSQLKVDYAAKRRELDLCKLQQSMPPPKEPQKGICELLKGLIGPSEFPEQATREDGWNPFLDIVFALAKSKKINDEAFNYEFGDVQIRVLEKYVDQMLDINFINEAEKLIKSEGWAKYLDWKQKGGNQNGSIDEVIQKINELKEYETPLSLNGLKAMLDRANYLTYLTIKSLHEKIGENNEMVDYFNRVYPAKLLDNYTVLFGDPNVYIMQQRFKDEFECSDDGTVNLYDALNGLKESTKLKDNIPAKPVPSPEEPTEEVEEDFPSYNGQSLVNTSSYGFTFYPRFILFEDAYQSRNLENIDHQFRCGNQETFTMRKTITKLEEWGGDASARDKAIQFWKWSYRKRPKDTTEYLKVVWAIFRGRERPGDQDNIYMVAEDLMHEKCIAKTKFLWENRSKIVIPDDMLEGFISGQRTVRIRMYDLMVYEGIVSENITFGKGEYKLNIPRIHKADLLKFLFIFHYLYMDLFLLPKKDDEDNWNIYSWGKKVGPLHPLSAAGRNLNNKQLLAKVNEKIAAITDTKIDLEIGTLFNRSLIWMDPDGMKTWISGLNYKNQSAQIKLLGLYRYFWYLVTNDQFIHPYEMGCGAMKKMFERLKYIKNAK